MNYPPAEPFYVISLEEILWGGMLIAITMALHGFGMLLVLRLNHTVKNRISTKKGLLPGLIPIILASCLIMIVHLSEVMVWSVFFMWKGAFTNPSLAYYFSLNEYTTVGSRYSLPQHWRLLEGMIAVAGLLTFAWSTGVLITLAHEFQDERMESFKQQHPKRSRRLTQGQTKVKQNPDS
jgi:hypothetical protein